MRKTIFDLPTTYSFIELVGMMHIQKYTFDQLLKPYVAKSLILILHLIMCFKQLVPTLDFVPGINRWHQNDVYSSKKNLLIFQQSNINRDSGTQFSINFWKSLQLDTWYSLRNIVGHETKNTNGKDFFFLRKNVKYKYNV